MRFIFIKTSVVKPASLALLGAVISGCATIAEPLKEPASTMPNTSAASATSAASKPLAEGSNSLFRHSVTVKASAERIWAIWMDVPNWPTWDTELKSASSAGPLALNVEGTLTPLKGMPSSFKVVAFEPRASYAFETALPNAKLKITRSLVTQGGSTTFTHEVEFTGAAGPVFAGQFGPVFRAALPEVMKAIAAQAMVQN